MRRRNLSFPDIAYGSLELLQEYLENGGTADLKDEQGISLMHAAAQANEVSKVELLLHHGGNMKARNAEGCTPLHVAYINKHDSVLYSLLEHNDNVKSVTYSKFIREIIRSKSCNMDKEFESYQQMAPLLHAIFTSRLAVEKLILTKGHECDVNMLFKDLNTQCTCLLCEYSISILPRDFVRRLRDQRERQRDLAIYLIYQDLELMKLFINHISELNILFLLQHAVKHGQLQAAELILTEFDYPFSLMQNAVNHGKPEVAELILAKFNNPFKPYILRFLFNLQPKSMSERLVKFIVKPYSLATTCSMENSVLRSMWYFHYNNEKTDRHLSWIRELLRVLIQYGLVIHSQAIRRFHRWKGIQNQHTGSNNCCCITCFFATLGISDLQDVASLKGQCCSVIRQNVHSCRRRFDFKTVQSLPLPVSLIDFICMKDW